VTDGTPDRRTLNVGAWLVALTVLALVVRLIRLNTGLWVDEIDSLMTSFRPSLTQIVTTFPRDNRHPFYSVLAHLCIQLFGEHPWSIRLPAVLFGTATVPLLYLLGARLMDRREALLAAALLAVSYHHVWFSQNARGYALLAFFAVLATWLLLRALEDGRKRFVIGYAVAIAFGAWTHLTMVFVAVGHAAACAIAFLFARGGRPAEAWKRLALAFVLSGLFTLLLYAPVLGDVANYFVHKPSKLRGVSTPMWALLEGVRVLLAGLGGAGAAAAMVALAAAALLFGSGLLSLWRTQPLVLGLFVMPGFVTIAGAAAARGTMYPRFFFSLAPYAVLLAVRGGFALAERVVGAGTAGRVPAAPGDAPAAAVSPRAERLATAVLLALIVLSAVSLVGVWRYPKQDFEGAARWVAAHRQPGDEVATVDLTAALYRDYYHQPYTPVATAAALDSLRQGHRVWLVYTFPRYLAQGAPEISAITERACRAATVFRGTVGGGDLYVCELGPMP